MAVNADGGRGPRYAILIVNGYDRHGLWGEYGSDEAQRYPWIELCLRQVERHSAGADYEVLVYDNAWLAEHRAVLRRHDRVRVFPPNGARVERGHPASLDILVRLTSPDVDFVVTLDSDAFPVRDNWLKRLSVPLTQGAGLSGIYRDELAPRIRPFIHPAGLCARRGDLLAYGVSFLKGTGQDVGQNLSNVLTRDRPAAPLFRSNARNFHPIIGGLYGDVLYHHGAGSRRPSFWGLRDPAWQERVRTTLRDAAFDDLPRLVATLRGTCDRDYGLPSRLTRATSVTTAAQFRGPLDVATLGHKLARTGVAQISNFLDDELARAARRYFDELPAEEWTVAVQAGDEAVYLRDVVENKEEIAAARENAQRSFERGKFSYFFRRTLDEHDVSCSCAECRLRTTLGSPAMLALLRQCGLAAGSLGEVFGSCYSPGSFLSPHHDRGNGTVGFSLNLSPRWRPEQGGLLMFLGPDWTTARRVITPTFNSLCLFALPPEGAVPHLVSHVITGRRFAVSGWFRGPNNTDVKSP